MVKLYLDENVPVAVSTALRLRGYDVLTVRDVGRKGLSDFEQLKYASSQNRVIFTFNVADFYRLHSEFMRKGLHHAGIILSRQLPIGTNVKGLLKLLSEVRQEKLSDNIIWLSDWIK